MESREKSFEEVGLEAVREFCNVVRRCNDAVEIEDLIAGVPGDEKLCVVARSVNCGLSVHPAYQIRRDDLRSGETIGSELSAELCTVWSIVGEGQHEELLMRVAAATESRMIPILKGRIGTWAVPVPRYVAECAQAFDNNEIGEAYYLTAEDPLHPEHDEWLEDQEFEKARDERNDESEEEVPF